MKQVAVIGAGTMGNGIAHVFAQNEYDVRLIDISESALNKALSTIEKNLKRMVQKDRITEADVHRTMSNISSHTSIADSLAQADLIVEAATENEETKTRIFKEMDQHSSPGCLLATNTSSISITKIATVVQNPERVIGMHFFNPVPVMKLVEVIQGYNTSKEVAGQVVSIAENLGKIPILVKDYPGFISNRVLMPMINEAIKALEQGVAGVREIDSIMKLGMAHPMGPLHLADFIGLDVCMNIMNVLKDGLGSDYYAPCPLLVNMVLAGKLGRKSGEGFYIHLAESKEIRVSEMFH